MADCTCGSGANPRRCYVHPRHFEWHVAELDVENQLEDTIEARAAFARYQRATDSVINDHKKEIERLKRLVYHKTPTKNSGFRWLMRTETKVGSSGSASDYEVWLRTKEYGDLSSLKSLFVSAIDTLRYRKRFVEHELERRHLYSEYGEHPIEALLPEDEG